MRLSDKAALSEIWRQREIPGLVATMGYSMYPLIHDGAWLTVQPCGIEDIHLGDIALFRQNGNLVAHRVVGKSPSPCPDIVVPQLIGELRIGKMDDAYLIHKGDTARVFCTVPSSGLLGKVVQIQLPGKIINLGHAYWRLANRFLGWYWDGFLKLRRWIRHNVPDNRIASGGRSGNYSQLLPRLVLYFGCRSGQGTDRLQPWEYLLTACITPQNTPFPGLHMGEGDWEKFLDAAREQRIQRLCYDCLCRHRKKVPEQILSRLSKSGHAAGFRSLKTSSELAEIIKTLKGAGMEVVLLKGAAMAHGIYENPAQRDMCDIDLLVKKKDLAHIETVLQGQGYSPVWGEDAYAKWCRHYATIIGYVKSGPDRNIIDIHWGLEHDGNFRFIPPEELWQRARNLDLDGMVTHMLSPEDALLHIAVHAVYHHCLAIDLRTWADIARLSMAGMDWPQLAARAKKYRAERMLFTVLYLAHKFGGAPVPPGILAELRRTCPHRLKVWLKRQTGLLHLRRPAMDTLWRLALIPGWHSKIRYLAAITFPSRGELSLLHSQQSDSWWSYLRQLAGHHMNIMIKVWGKLMFRPVPRPKLTRVTIAN